MGRRGHDEGTIFERVTKRTDGTKVTRYTSLLPLNDQGKRPSLGTFKTRTEAKQALRDAAVAQAQGTLALGKAPTAAEWFDTWLAGRTRIAYTTRVDYQQTFRMVRPYIGHIRLNQLTEQHIAHMWARLATGIAADGAEQRPVAATTLAKRHAHVSAALRAAVRSRTIPITYNPAQGAKPERGSRKEINPLSEDEVQRLFATTRGDPDFALWVTLLTTGCRPSECRALRWRDVDFARCTIAICGSVHRENGKGWVEGPTKTKRNRVVTLRPETVNALRTHKARQAEMRLAAGPAWQDHDYVFTSETGAALDNGTLGRRFDAACRKAGLARRTLKETRHTFATLGLVHNVPVKIISEALGHASVQMTLDVYSHVIAGLQEDSLSHLDRLFG
jgi:integrase